MALSSGGDAESAAQDAIDKAKGKPAGRKTSTGISAAMKSKVVVKAMPELIVAGTRLERAKDNFNSVVNKIAEEAGFEAKHIAKLVKAHMSDDFGKHERDAKQLSILFTDVQPKDWKKDGGKVEE
jgi:hypothetical protein